MEGTMMASNAVPTTGKRAVLFRMVMPTHICPFGLKARWLLRHKGYDVEDHWLTDRAEQDAFKAEHGVQTTPQTFIDGERVGGYDDLRRFLGLAVADPKATSYWPVVAVFGVAAGIALAINWLTGAPLVGMVGAGRFVAVAMCLLAMLKLQDVERFATMFLGYDLLARTYVPYAYAYPFTEFGAGALMLAGVATWLSAPVALIIGGIGAVSVIKAVYLDKRELKCACVGGSGNVPLGFVSLTENLGMIAMAVWMVAR
jgi:glutaredoxin